MTNFDEPRGFHALIEAFEIFLEYGDPAWPTHCEHDVLTIVGIDPADVSPEDTERLDHLGFFVSEEHDYVCFRSYRFGSA